MAALLVAGCGHQAAGDAPATTSAPVASAAPAVTAAPVATVAKAPAKKAPFTPARPGCESVAVFAAGAADGAVCVEDAEKNGLTIVDLSNDWTPRVFAVDGRGAPGRMGDAETHDAPEYREKYLELANQRGADLGLYGIAPNVGVVADRLLDDKRIACDDDVDTDAIASLKKAIAEAKDAREASALLKKPEAKDGISAIEQELACAGHLSRRAVSGRVGSSTHAALDAFRRRHMIVGTGLDADTTAALALGGEELDFRALLRVLRERVAESAGLIEDGSAANEQALVADRALDLSRFAPNREALDDAAPDLVGAATDAAARALGWTSPAKARAFLKAQGKQIRTLKVAVALPARPAYSSASMDLRVEIDRGDVFYETPGAAAVARKKLGTMRTPTFVVYAKDGDKDRALVRWTTTIGGWKKERTEEGEIELKYKESDVGERFWRQIIAAPAWMPPDSTPEGDLLRSSKDGTVALKKDLIQPGYHNAYGLVMLVHDEKVTHGSKTTWVDHGIRTHGSVDYRSISRGESHGCHRLYNQLALRLSGFMLDHRDHVRRGKLKTGYHRSLAFEGQTVDFDVPVRGYLYELDPPVPVRVLEGRVHGDAKRPLSTIPLAPQGDSKKG